MRDTEVTLVIEGDPDEVEALVLRLIHEADEIPITQARVAGRGLNFDPPQVVARNEGAVEEEDEVEEEAPKTKTKSKKRAA